MKTKNNTNCKPQTKWLLSLIFSLSLLTSLNAQTYIEPSIGLQFSKNISPNYDVQTLYSIENQNFIKNNSIVYGIAASQYYNNNFSLRVKTQFSKRKEKIYDYGFVGYSDLRFKTFNISVLPFYTFKNNFEFGIGPTYNRLSGFEIGFDEGDYWLIENKYYEQNQIGLRSSLLYRLKPVVLSISYSNLKSLNSKLIKKSHILELGLNVMIKTSAK